MTAYKNIPIAFAEGIISIVAKDRSGRGVSKVCKPLDWQLTAEALAGAKCVAVISGFYVPSAKAPETDGPGGAVMLARAYLKAGRKAEIWTDELCLDVMKKCAAAAGVTEGLVKIAPGSLKGTSIDALIYTERLGRASDGRYYNCRKEDITEWTSPVDGLAEEARGLGVVTAGIGDGGNETGMGYFNKELTQLLPDYKSCLCTVGTDRALAADVSNWGAYALTAALSLLWGKWCGPIPGEELAMLNAVRQAGAVDGISKKTDITVDGFDIYTQDRVILLLGELWKEFDSSNK